MWGGRVSVTWKVTLCDDDDVDDDIEHNVDDDVDELMLIIRRKRMIVTLLTRMITGAQFLIWGCIRETSITETPLCW